MHRHGMATDPESRRTKRVASLARGRKCPLSVDSRKRLITAQPGCSSQAALTGMRSSARSRQNNTAAPGMSPAKRRVTRLRSWCRCSEAQCLILVRKARLHCAHDRGCGIEDFLECWSNEVQFGWLLSADAWQYLAATPVVGYRSLEAAMLASLESPTPSVLPPTLTRRAITHRSRGRSHGPITRLMSPSDLGESSSSFQRPTMSGRRFFGCTGRAPP